MVSMNKLTTERRAQILGMMVEGNSIRAIVRMTGTNVYWISFGITAVCGTLAAFIGEHTVAAMMLPVGVTLITLTSNDPKKVRNLAARLDIF